jgi:hypothetical protein
VRPRCLHALPVAAAFQNLGFAQHILTRDAQLWLRVSGSRREGAVGWAV